jgi:hypothetical protein
LAGERAYGLAVFAEPVKLLENSPYSSTECLKDDLVIGFSKSTGIFEQDRTFYLDALEKSVAAASLPFPERLNLGLLIPNPRAASRFFSVSRQVLPKISDAFVSEANMAALLRSAQTALAVERFRCRHGGRLPGKLEELVPAYCEALPLDPFDGTPLRFEILDLGYAVDSSAFDTRNGGHLGFRVIRRGDDSFHAISGP